MASSCTVHNGLGLVKATNLPQTCANQDTLNKALTILFLTIGAIAVLMLVIGGVRYATARSDPQRIQNAKNVILYSLIGLIVSLSAAGIVNVVLGYLK